MKMVIIMAAEYYLDVTEKNWRMKNDSILQISGMAHWQMQILDSMHRI
jgi:hypothetical protein